MTRRPRDLGASDWLLVNAALSFYGAHEVGIAKDVNRLLRKTRRRLVAAMKEGRE